LRNPQLGVPLKEQRPTFITNFQTIEATKHATAAQLLGWNWAGEKFNHLHHLIHSKLKKESLRF